MIHPISSPSTSVVSTSVLRRAALGAILLSVSLGQAFGAPAKTKIGAKKAPAPGLTLEGSGVCTLQATFSGATAGVPSAPFSSIGRNKDFGNRIVSSSTAAKQNGYSVVISFIKGRRKGDLGPPRDERDIERNIPESDLERERRLSSPSTSMMLTFSSPGGFRAGQTIPVVVPARRPKPPAQSFISLSDVVRIEGREVIDGNGKRRREGKNRIRTWVAVSGAFRVQSVASDLITFKLENVRFTALQPASSQNAATGSFLLQGSGQCTFNEVD